MSVVPAGRRETPRNASADDGSPHETRTTDGLHVDEPA
jgi:hypothetical protein